MDAHQEYEALQSKHADLCQDLVEHMDKVLAADRPPGNLVAKMERMIGEIQDLREAITSHPAHKELLSRCLKPN